MVKLKMSYDAGALSSLEVERSFVEVGCNVAHLGTSVATGRTGSGFFYANTQVLHTRKEFQSNCLQAMAVTVTVVLIKAAT